MLSLCEQPGLSAHGAQAHECPTLLLVSPTLLLVSPTLLLDSLDSTWVGTEAMPGVVLVAECHWDLCLDF